MSNKVWTSAQLTLDDKSAFQSRRGGNASRYRDGTLRPNRPLPPHYSPRGAGRLPSLGSSSPRYEKPDLPWLWDDTNRYDTTHQTGYCDPSSIASLNTRVTRHGSSLRNKPAEVGELVFGTGGVQEAGPLNGGGTNREPMVLPGTVALSPRMQEVAALTPAVNRLDLTDHQKLRNLRSQLKAEERLTESARAHLATSLRRARLPTGVVGH
jgi:hypothetical protein